MLFAAKIFVKNLGRASGWSKLRREFLAEHPTCAACGTRKKLEVHHVESVSQAPDKELEKGNLLTLCEGSMKCHFVWGHLGSWRSINITARDDVAEFRRKVEERP